MKYIPAAYQTPGRISVDFIAIHWMNTTLDGCIRTFTDGQRQASAHYGVEDANVVNFVKDENTAWALGNWDANQRGISIEHSAQPGRLATDATYKTSIKLIADLCIKHNLTPGTDTILPHNHFQATQCPGTMDLTRIINGVQALILTPQPLATTDKDKKKMLTIARTKDDPAVFVGDGITRRYIASMDDLTYYQWAAQNGYLNIYKNGEVQTFDRLSFLGVEVK